MRINSVEHASETILWPALRPVMEAYPDIDIEIINDYRMTDIVASRFDAGVRLGEQVAQDMIALRIGPDFAQALVASPAYLTAKGTPQVPHDVMEHDCVLLRLPSSGGLWPWTFIKDGPELTVRAPARTVFNTVPMMQRAAVDGVGIASLPEDIVAKQIEEGRLVRVLADWSPVRPGYHLYYQVADSNLPPSPSCLMPCAVIVAGSSCWSIRSCLGVEPDARNDGLRDRNPRGRSLCHHRCLPRSRRQHARHRRRVWRGCFRGTAGSLALQSPG